MDFEKRLERAIQRGSDAAAAKHQAEREKELSEEQLKRLHSQSRLALSEHIEQSMKKLPNFLPGFQYESVVSDRGWGAAVVRDDLAVGSMRGRSLFSRLEIVVRPFSTAHVLELEARGTIRNREIFSRSHYHMLDKLQLDALEDQVQAWILEFAELYARER